MNHKLLWHATLWSVLSANKDNMLFSPLMITRRCFPHIPGLDVNSFGKKMSWGRTKGYVMWWRGISCWMIHTKAQAMQTQKQVMWPEVLHVPSGKHPHGYSAHSNSLCNNQSILIQRSIYSSTLVKQTIILYKRDHCSFWCPAHNHWQIDVMFL